MRPRTFLPKVGDTIETRLPATAYDRNSPRVLKDVYTSSPKTEGGAQIDLVIKRSDKVINICEMKYYNGEYVTRKKDKEDIERKVRIFKADNNIKSAVLPVLVTTYGLKANSYSEVFQNVVTLKDLFVI